MQNSKHYLHLDKHWEEFPLSPFKIRHSLASHPLFEPDRIKKLLSAVPREKIEVRAVKTKDADDGSFMRREKDDTANPIEAFEQLEEKTNWILVHESWIHDAGFKELLNDYISEMRQHFGEMAGKLNDLGCWLFLSSGSSVVHFHSDPDQSFLNQIKGSKTVYTYPASVLDESMIEGLVFTGDQKAVQYQPDYEQHLNTPVNIKPGESVFLPTFAPHRVINDEGLSISLNVGFNTQKSTRRKRIHLVNHHLRRLGFTPKHYNQSTGVDDFKNKMYFITRVSNKIQQILS